MMQNIRFKKQIIVTLSLSVVLAGLAGSYLYTNFIKVLAQTIPTNSILIEGGTNEQTNPILVESDNNSAIVIFTEWSYDYAYNVLYAKKIDYEGNDVWGSTTVLVDMQTFDDNLFNPHAYPDGLGGAFILWERKSSEFDTNFSLYITRINSSGTLVFANDLLFPAMTFTTADLWVADSLGTNLFVAITQGSSIYAQVAGLDGSVLPTDATVASGSNALSSPSITAINANSAVLYWTDTVTREVFAQKINNSGSNLWATPLAAVTAAISVPAYTKSVVNLSGTKSYISYIDSNSLYISGVLLDGSNAFTPLKVSNHVFVSNQHLEATKTDDILVTWEYFNGTDYDLYYQRISEDFTLELDPNGQVIVNATDYQTGSTVHGDMENGFIIAWEDQGHTDGLARYQWVKWNDTMAYTGDATLIDSSRTSTLDQMYLDTISLTATNNKHYNFIVFSETDDDIGDFGNIYLKITELPDTMAPETEYSITPEDCSGSGNWCNQPTEVALSTEPSAAIYYSIDGSAPTDEYTLPIVLTESMVLKFQAHDINSNIETLRTLDFNYDDEDPVTTISPSYTPVLTYLNTPFSIVLNANDGISGIASSYYKNDPVGEYSEYTGDITISTDGQHYISYYSEDVAGNTEAEQIAEYFLDTAVPVLNANFNFRITSGELNTFPAFDWDIVLEEDDPSPSSGLKEICITVFDTSDIQVLFHCVDTTIEFYEFDSALVPGSYYAHANLNDNAGNASETSTRIDFDINPNSQPDAPTNLSPNSIQLGGNDSTFDAITFGWIFNDTDPTDNQAEYLLQIVDFDDTGVILYDSGWQALASPNGGTVSQVIDVNSSGDNIAPGTQYKWHVKVKDAPISGFTKESAWSSYASFTTNHRPSVSDTTYSNDNNNPSVVASDSLEIVALNSNDADSHYPLEYSLTIGEFDGTNCANTTTSNWQVGTSFVQSSLVENTLYCFYVNVRDSEGMPSEDHSEMYYVTYNQLPSVDSVELCKYDTTCVETINIDTGVLSSNFNYKLSITTTDPDLYRIETIIDDLMPVQGVGAHLAADVQNGLFYYYDNGYIPFMTPLDIGDITVIDAGYTDLGSGTYKVEYVITFNTTWSSQDTTAVHVMGLDDASASSHDERINLWSSFGNLTFDFVPPVAPAISIDDDGYIQIVEFGGNMYSRLTTIIHAEHTTVDDALRYEYAVGISGNVTSLTNWTEVTTSPLITASGLSLSHNNSYLISIRAIDEHENISPISSASWITDFVAPTIVGQPHDYPSITNNNLSIDFNMSDTYTAVSGIKNYRYNIVEDYNDVAATSITGWIYTPDNNPAITHTFASAIPDGQYYIVTRASSNVGIEKIDLNHSGVIIIDTENNDIATPLVDDYINSRSSFMFSWEVAGNPSVIQYGIGDSMTTPNITGDWIDTGTTVNTSDFVHNFGSDVLVHGQTYYVLMRTLDPLNNISPITYDQFVVDTDAPLAPAAVYDIRDFSSLNVDIDFSNSVGTTTLYYSWLEPTVLPPSGIHSYKFKVYQEDLANPGTYVPLSNVIETTNLQGSTDVTTVNEGKYVLGIISIGNNGSESSSVLNITDPITSVEYGDDLADNHIGFSDGIRIDTVPYSFSEIHLPYYSSSLHDIETSWVTAGEVAPLVSLYAAVGTSSHPDGDFNSIKDFEEIPGNISPFIISGMDLTDTNSYYVTLKSIDAAGNEYIVSGDHSFTIDTTPPDILLFEVVENETTVFDGSVYYTSTPENLTLHLVASDATSQISGYRYNVYDDTDTQLFADWIVINTTESDHQFSIDVSGYSSDYYTVHIEAINGSGLNSAESISNHVMIDDSEPVISNIEINSFFAYDEVNYVLDYENFDMIIYASDVGAGLQRYAIQIRGGLDSDEPDLIMGNDWYYVDAVYTGPGDTSDQIIMNLNDFGVTLVENQPYHLAIKAIDKVARESGLATNAPFYIDTLAPNTPVINENQTLFTNSVDTISSSWVVNMPETGKVPVISYIYALGTASYPNLAYNSLIPDTAITEDNIAATAILQDDTDYFVSVLAQDAAGRESVFVSSLPIHTDWTPPTSVMPFFDTDYTYFTNSVNGYLSALAVDDNSGIAYYEYAMGTTQYPDTGFNAGTNIVRQGCSEDGSGWQQASISTINTSGQFFFTSCMYLLNGQSYYLAIRAVDRAGNVSDVQSTNTTLHIDTSPPIFDIRSQIYDNSTERSYRYTVSDARRRVFTQFNNSVYLKYKATDGDYPPGIPGVVNGIKSYEYAVGYSINDVDFRSWGPLTMDTCPTQTDMYCATVSTVSNLSEPLQESTSYYIHIRARNVANNLNTYRSGALIHDATPPALNDPYGDYIQTPIPFTNDENEFRMNFLFSDVTSGLADYQVAVGNEVGPVGSTSPYLPGNWNSLTDIFYPETEPYITLLDDRNPIHLILTYSTFRTNELLNPMSHDNYYYGSVHVRDKAFNETLYSTNGADPDPFNGTISDNGPVYVDLTYPNAPVVVAIDLPSGYASSGLTELPVSFGPASDPETGIYHYEYSIYQVHKGTFMEDHTNVILSNTSMRNFTIENVSFEDGEYQVWMRAVNNTFPYSKDALLERSYSSWTKSLSLIIDNTPPEPPSYIKFINPDTYEVIEYSNKDKDITIKFPPADDKESGIESYQYAISNFSDYNEDNFIVDYTTMPNYDLEQVPEGFAYKINYNTFRDQETYYVYVKAKNNAGLWSGANVSSTGIKMDFTPPENLTGLFEGNAGYIDNDGFNSQDYWGLATEMPFGWLAGSDNFSGIQKYSYRIYYKNTISSTTQYPVTEWTDYDSDMSTPYFVENSLNFNNGKVYLIEINAIDYAGNVSETSHSDGIVVDSTPPTKPWVFLERNYASSLENILVSWESTDKESGIMEYYVRVINNRREHVWPDNADIIYENEKYFITDEQNYNFDLRKYYESGDHFYFEVYAVNNAGVVSGKGKSSAQYVDITPPVVEYLKDPIAEIEVYILDEGEYTSRSDQLKFSWIIYDNESDIEKYWYALGTNGTFPEDGWNSVISGEEGDGFALLDYDPHSSGSIKTLTLDHLDLVEGETYYFYLIGFNKAGLETPLLQSNGITLDNAAPITKLKAYLVTPEGDLFNKQIIVQMSVISDNEVFYKAKFDYEPYTSIPPVDGDWDSIPSYWNIRYSDEPLGTYDISTGMFDNGQTINDLSDARTINTIYAPSNYEFIIVRDDFAERSHLLMVQTGDAGGNIDETPETFTWRVGESMKMYSTNWFTSEELSSGHRQTTVPDAPLKVVTSEGDTDQFYRVMVGPQSFATAIITLSEMGVVRDTAVTEFQSPISIRPRSLFGAELPDLILTVPGVAGEILSFNQSGADGDSALRYLPDKDINFDENGNVDITELVPFQLLDNTGSVPDDAKIVIEVPEELRNLFRPSDGITLPERFASNIEYYKNSLRIGTLGETIESLETPGDTIEIPTILYNKDGNKIYEELSTDSYNGIEFPLASWNSEEMKIEVGLTTSDRSYLVDKFINLENMSFGPFNDPDANKFMLTQDGFFNFALSPQDTKIAGKNLVLEVMMKVVIDKENPDEQDEYFYMKPFKIIFTILPNVPSMVHDETSPNLEPSDTTHLLINPTTE